MRAPVDPRLGEAAVSRRDATDPDAEAPPDRDSQGTAILSAPEPETELRSLELEMEEDGELEPGAMVGERYRIERVIGKGAAGVVYEASHAVIGKRVALKCLFPHQRANATSVARFFREARIAATVEHDNVVQVFDGDESDRVAFLAMELVDGETLAHRLERDGALPVLETVDLFLAILDGLAAVHDAGVIHRDLKPDNVILPTPRRGRARGPKVLDFGISKLKEPSGRELTTLGTVMGTPFYMAPEQMTDTSSVDPRADVYSLGVMMYEALTDEVPYDGSSVVEIFEAARAGAATPIRELRPEVPPELAALISKAMSGRRSDRFRTVAEMLHALGALGLTDTDPSRDRPPERDLRATAEDPHPSLPETELDRERAHEIHLRDTALHPRLSRDAPPTRVAITAPPARERTTDSRPAWDGPAWTTTALLLAALAGVLFGAGLAGLLF